MTNSDAPGHTDLMVPPESFDICSDCGDVLTTGSWPFCASDRNPSGHARGGAYAWSMGSPIRKWTRDPKLGRG